MKPIILPFSLFCSLASLTILMKSRLMKMICDFRDFSHTALPIDKIEDETIKRSENEKKTCNFSHRGRHEDAHEEVPAMFPTNVKKQWSWQCVMISMYKKCSVNDSRYSSSFEALHESLIVSIHR